MDIQPMDCSARAGIPSGRILIKAQHVSTRIAEARGDLRRVSANRLHDLAAVGDNSFNRGGNAIDHDVNEKSGSDGRRTANHPRAAYLAHAVIKGGAPITALTDLPSKNLPVEFSGAGNVSGGHLDIADLAVFVGRRHVCPFKEVAILKGSHG